VLKETPHVKAFWAVVGAVFFMLATIATLTRSFLGVALGGAFALATVSIFLFDRYYLQRPRAFRLGAIGTTIASAVIWLIVFGVVFFFIYYPDSIWPS
jgi:hypothetical protein